MDFSGQGWAGPECKDLPCHSSSAQEPAGLQERNKISVFGMKTEVHMQHYNYLV